jgi:hypothetical protein
VEKFFIHHLCRCHLFHEITSAILIYVGSPVLPGELDWRLSAMNAQRRRGSSQADGFFCREVVSGANKAESRRPRSGHISILITVSEETCRRGKNMSTNSLVNQINRSESEPFNYSVSPMAIATSAFVLRSRESGLRNPGLVYGDAEGPGDLVNLEEQIPCIDACGIRSNPIWNPIVSRSNSWPYPQEAEARKQPTANAAANIP